MLVFFLSFFLSFFVVVVVMRHDELSYYVHGVLCPRRGAQSQPRVISQWTVCLQADTSAAAPRKPPETFVANDI